MQARLEGQGDLCMTSKFNGTTAQWASSAERASRAPRNSKNPYFRWRFLTWPRRGEVTIALSRRLLTLTFDPKMS